MSTDTQQPEAATPPPLTPSTPTNTVSALLKSPAVVAAGIAEKKNLLKQGVIFFLCAIGFHAVFGVAIGFFGGWEVALMDVVKVPLVAICSLLLCYPSLYVFSCVGGTPLSPGQAFALGASCLAMIGLLLVGLAPVAWLFAASTESVPFVVVLTFVIWLIAIIFTTRYIAKLQAHALFKRAPGVKFWFVILVFVTLQMTTCMRPMLSKNESGWWVGEKKFFLSHFGSTFDTQKKR